MAADLVVFNSEFNRDSFLNNINTIIKLLPDYRPKELHLQIKPKCRVLYFPIDFPILPSVKTMSNILNIVWPHRWEFDKNPELFFKVLYKLKENNKKFLVSILGEVFMDIPDIFSKAREHLKKEIINFGFMEKKEDYFKVLCSSHVVVSTTDHEFFGVSMLVTSL